MLGAGRVPAGNLTWHQTVHEDHVERPVVSERVHRGSPIDSVHYLRQFQR